MTTVEYKFPDTDYDIKKLTEEDDLLQKKIDLDKPKPSDFIIAGLFDVNKFNIKFSEINEINRKKRKIKDQIKLKEMSRKNLDLNDLTIGQLKNGLMLDIYDMFIEIGRLDHFNLKNFMKIIKKNYRLLTILIFLTITIIIIYLFIQWINI